MIVLVGENRHDIGFGTIVFKVLRERASPRGVELVTQHQHATAPKADFE